MVALKLASACASEPHAAGARSLTGSRPPLRVGRLRASCARALGCSPNSPLSTAIHKKKKKQKEKPRPTADISIVVNYRTFLLAVDR